MNKPKQHRIGCRQQRKGKFRITYDLNVETWINEEVSHGEIIRNVRKVSQSPLPWDTSASDEINELYYLPKTLILTSTKKLVSSCHTPFLGLWNDKPHDVPELNMRSCFSCRRLVQAAQLEGKFPFLRKHCQSSLDLQPEIALTYWFSLSRRMLRQKWQNQVKDAAL